MANKYICDNSDSREYFSLQWHITDACDQRCKHCYIFNVKNAKCSGMGKPLSGLVAILDNFLESCVKMDRIPYIAITGGDPLLHPNFWELLTEISERDCEFSIMGNPFHITKDVAERLYGLGLRSYQMSIDGLESTHDHLRKPGSFKATINAMPILKNAGIHPSVMMTVSRINYNEIPALIDWLAENSVVDMISFARYCPTHDDFETMLTGVEYKSFLEAVWEIYQKYKNSSHPILSFKDHLWKPFLMEKGIFKTQENNDMIMDGCHCGISGLSCLADGTVYACRRMESPVGHVPEQSIHDIFFSDNMEKYREWDKFEKCAQCKLLNYCRGCPAVAYGVTGNFYAPDPQCWMDITKKL